MFDLLILKISFYTLIFTICNYQSIKFYIRKVNFSHVYLNNEETQDTFFQKNNSLDSYVTANILSASQ